jgi:hypothetical protein
MSGELGVLVIWIEDRGRIAKARMRCLDSRVPFENRAIIRTAHILFYSQTHIDLALPFPAIASPALLHDFVVVEQIP